MKKEHLNMPQQVNAYALLLAGGSGTRLWPVSRDLYPKQLVRFIENRSLLQHTALRLSSVFESNRLKIVCGTNHVNDVTSDMAEMQMDHAQMIINEPCGRNTAPAILLGALRISQTHPDAVIFVFPADHVIDRMSQFYEKINLANQLAQEGHIVTFGIEPEYPETGYGYIEASEMKVGHGYQIKQFVEKPDLITARKYIEAGNFYWNAGMFAFKVSVLLKSFETHCPEMLHSLKDMLDEKILDTESYQSLESISFDYAIMEKIDNGVVLPADFQWSDIGSWKALYEFLPKDSQKNVTIGNKNNILMQKTQNCLAMGQKRLIVMNQLKNIALIDTPDALFVSDINHSRDAKDAVAFLQAHGRDEHIAHVNQRKPWGEITVLDNQPDCVVSKYNIHSGCEMSTLKNTLYLKQWHFIKGHGVVHIDNNETPIHAGEHITIESGMIVSCENHSMDPLVFIEMATALESSASDEMFFE